MDLTLQNGLSILNALETPLIICDSTGIITFANAAALELIGYENQELVARPLSNITIEADATIPKQPVSVPESPRTMHLRRRDGRDIAIEMRLIPLVESFGSPLLLLPCDTYTERELEQRLPQAQGSASIATLYAGTVHDINNPLAYALGSIDLAARKLEALMQTTDFEPETRQALQLVDECVHNARDGADRIRVIVGDLLAAARPTERSAEGVHLLSVLDSAINLAWNEIRHRARLVKNYQRIPPVQGDSARLGQVFLNLIVNAAQAIVEGEVEDNEIRVVAKYEQGRVLVEVEDTGIGMSEEIRARIFEPFFTTKPAGTGLGLSVCQGIINALGGDIEVESKPGRGSCFRIALEPASRDAAPVLVNEADGQTDRAPARILIIDDEPLLGHTLKLAFRDRHEVESVTSGRQALARLEDDRAFDLILCDLMMPDMSGMAVYEQALAQYPELQSRFAFMTGGAFTERARTFLSAHPDRTLNKPFVLEDVEGLLAELRKANSG